MLYLAKFKSSHASEDRYLKYSLSIFISIPKVNNIPTPSYLDFMEVERIENVVK